MPWGGLGPDVAAVSSNDSLGRSQPNASAWKVALAVKPLEKPEKTVGLAHVESCSVVTHLEYPLPIPAAAME